MYSFILFLFIQFQFSSFYLYHVNAEKRTEAISWPPLEASVQKYQDPANGDQITRIQVFIDNILINSNGKR